MMRFAQQPSTCTKAASMASTGKQTEPQQDGVRVFGATAKSNAEIIAEMLAKLPAPPGLHFGPCTAACICLRHGDRQPQGDTHALQAAASRPRASCSFDRLWICGRATALQEV
mmetsp:Transcript_49848/g.160215  ORF Transcript_49848/g.160215 Transcript_49848/m.160215 type:complete len:113 (+) Transcript_49848:99-437(+)